MSERPPQLPPPSNPWLLPVLATVTWAATVVASSGVLSLALDRDVIDYPDAGPLLGVGMVLAGGAATLLGCRRALRSPSPWLPALLTGLAAFAAFVLVGAVGYTLIRAEGVWMLLAAEHFALSPFVVAAAALSFLVTVAAWALSRPHRGGPPSPEDR